MRITPARRIKGRARLPGDKSISHRAALIAALASGRSHVSNFSTSHDCASTLSCLSKLGFSIEREGNHVTLDAPGKGRFAAPAEPLDCGNSGSTMRMLAGILAGQNFTATLTGDDSLKSRPMKRIIEPLEMMGAKIQSEDGKPPLRIQGSTSIMAIRYELPVASAQVKSCILLAGLSAQGRTEAIESQGKTRDHTERMLRWFGVPMETGNRDGVTVIAVDGPIAFDARDVSVPGDISSAAFLIAAAALLPGSELEIEDVGLNPTRTQFLTTLRSLNIDALEIETCQVREECNERLGTIRVSSKLQPEVVQHTKSNSVKGNLVPQLIDELPLLAVIGTQVSGGLEIRDAIELRFKETDRISATVNNLRAMGAEVEEYEDGLAVTGPTSLRGASLDSYGDHRIAMAFAIAGLLAHGESKIAGAECVKISFPEFFDLLESVVER